MTWSEFTSYLDGSRPLRKAERDELYDNLDELLTGGCADAGYSLNAAAQTAIKASRLRTDLASLDGPGATNTTGRLHDVLEAASEAFVNYDDAVADALSAEGLTSTERDDILAARLDDWRLWNYYRRVIDALECCAPAVATDQSASAYLRESFSGTIAAAGDPPYSFSASGLPPGLSLNSTTGAITGTPTSAGTYPVAVSVENDCGIDTATFTITVYERCNYSYADAGSGPADGTIYDQTLSVAGYFPVAYLMTFAWETDGPISIEMEADGTTFYGPSGTALTGGSVVVNVPSGTSSLRVIILDGSGASNSISWTLVCGS